MHDVVTLGETMILLVPKQVGQLRYAHQFDKYIAGAESNTAVGLARVGHKVGWVSRVGDDEFGHSILTFLRGENVDVSQVVLDGRAPTGVFFKERRRTGSTRVFYYRAGSAASFMTPADLDEAYIQQAKILHLTGITPALSESGKETLHAAIEAANGAGVTVAFDPNVRYKLWSADAAKKTFADILPNVQIVLTSSEEAQLITGIENPQEAARAIHALGPNTVVVKMGDKGAIGYDGTLLEAPPVNVDVVETVGAGDAFNAGFLSGRLRGWDLGKCLELGNILGALATTVPGDVEGLPTWSEVQAFWKGGDIVDR